MQSIPLTTHIGEDGILTVQIPSELKDTDLEVMMVFQPIPKKQGWQPEFFDEVIGGWEEETLVRAEQGKYENRERLYYCIYSATNKKNEVKIYVNSRKTNPYHTTRC